jgi:hypothetical protein
MKFFLSITLFYLLSLSAISQKVTVKVIRVDNKNLSEWKILDDEYRSVYSGKDFFQDDTVELSLDAGKQYFLQISFSEVYTPGSIIYSFQLDDEPIMLINSEIGPGEHLFPFFTGTRSRDVKITGGTGTVISDFPWQVYVIAGNYRCGGSIINENWILTAAHCTKNSDGTAILASEMAIKVGVNNPYNTLDGKRYLVTEVIVHEGYNSQSLENDIALLKLEVPVNFPNAVPVRLVSADDVLEGATIPGVMSWVTGWGLTNVSPKVFPTTLQKVQLPIVSNSTASIVWTTIPTTDIMAGYRNGNKDACSGDSGGPMVVPVLGEYKLAGIVSWGSSNCNTYGGYTRVSLFDTWIRTKTGIPKEYKPPSPLGDRIVCDGEISGIYSIDKIPAATTYQWRLYPAEAGVISGNTEISSVLWNISYSGTVNVLVRVTINNVVSDWSKLAVKIVANTKLLRQSVDTVLCEGLPVSLNVVAEGFNLNYNWYQNGTIVQSGTSNQLSFLSSIPDNSGAYKSEISGSCGTVRSGTINLTVHPLTRIISISPDIEAHFGSDITLNVTAGGHDLSYQWEKDGILLNNSIASQLFIPGVNANDIGLYQTIVSGTCGTEISDSVYVYVTKDNFLSDTEVFVWPTLTGSTFSVALSNDDSYTIEIYSTMGRLIRKQTNCRYQTSVNISTLPKDVYIIRILSGNFKKSIKLIKY